MKMKKVLFALGIVMVGFIACKKKGGISCDNAELRIKNIGNDTIWYAFNSSSWDKMLLPDSTISEFVGPIEVGGDSESLVTTTFESDHGNYAITVDDCVVNREIQ